MVLLYLYFIEKNHPLFRYSLLKLKRRALQKVPNNLGL